MALKCRKMEGTFKATWMPPHSLHVDTKFPFAVGCRMLSDKVHGSLLSPYGGARDELDSRKNLIAQTSLFKNHL